MDVSYLVMFTVDYVLSRITNMNFFIFLSDFFFSFRFDDLCSKLAHKNFECVIRPVVTLRKSRTLKSKNQQSNV